MQPTLNTLDSPQSSKVRENEKMLHSRQQDLIRLTRETAAKMRRIAATTKDADLAVQLQNMADEEDTVAAGLENALQAMEAFN